MTTSTCAYCGALAENPVRLSWAIDDDPDRGPLAGSLPLCVTCSQSWCPQPQPALAACADGENS